MKAMPIVRNPCQSSRRADPNGGQELARMSLNVSWTNWHLARFACRDWIVVPSGPSAVHTYPAEAQLTMAGRLVASSTPWSTAR